MANDRWEERALVLAPTGRDAPMICRALCQAGLDAQEVRDIGGLCGEWRVGAGAAVVAEEALAPQALPELAAAVSEQPAWSDLPLVILTSGGKATRSSTLIADALRPRGNVTLLERPVRTLTLVSAVQAALRARRRQYEVRDLLEQARREVELRDQFLAMLAHELRNPLAPIRNAVQVQRLVGGVDANLRWSRDVIERQVEHLTRMVDDLLDVSRVSRGKIQLQKDRVELASALARAVEVSRPLIDARRQELTVSLPPGPVQLEADEARLVQVVANLLNNASKYSDEGKRLWLIAAREGSQAVIRVKDEGVGIPADVLPQVFNLFVQADRSLDRSQGGLGIGLTLVRRVVELHGGTVRASSEGPGMGSEFVVSLPALPEVRRPAPCPEAAGRPAAVPPRRVLVVDDNQDSAESLALLLRLQGHEVRTAADGPSALEAAAAWLPEVVLLDIGLPRMDGYQVSRQMRQLPGLERAVIAATTGYGQSEDRRRSFEAGFDAHLVKPVEPAALRELLAGRRGPGS